MNLPNTHSYSVYKLHLYISTKHQHYFFHVIPYFISLLTSFLSSHFSFHIISTACIIHNFFHISLPYIWPCWFFLSMTLPHLQTRILIYHNLSHSTSHFPYIINPNILKSTSLLNILHRYLKSTVLSKRSLFNHMNPSFTQPHTSINLPCSAPF